MHQLKYLAVLALATVASALPQWSIGDIISRAREEVREEVPRLPNLPALFDDKPTHLVLNPGYANNDKAFLSYFTYEPPQDDNAYDTYDGIFNLFRKYNLNGDEERRLRERSYWIRADFDETQTRVSLKDKQEQVKTEDNGTVQRFVPIGVEEPTDGPIRVEQYQVTSLEEGGQTASSFVLGHKNGGTLVISDIDDIVKETDTNSVDETFANTFWRPYRAIDKMPELMSKLNATNGASNDVSFHYVTGIPIVLSPPLIDWILSVYPAGSFTFRPTTQLDWDSINTVFRQGGFRRDGIARILDTFPDQKAIIFGDTWGTSLQSFADLIERYHQRPVCYYLRRLSPGRSDDDIYRRLADDSDKPANFVKQKVILYNSPKELLERPDLTTC